MRFYFYFLDNNQLYILQVRYFTEDKTKPIIRSFSLDLNLGYLSLVFSETVNASSILLTQITLQNRQFYPSLVYRLTGGSVLTPNGPSITILLNISGLNSIKAIDGLADANGDPSSNTFLAATSLFIRDMNDNFNEEIRSDIMALGLSMFYPDQTRPYIISSILNLDQGSILLSFSETVRESTLDISMFTLQDNTTAHRYFINNANFSFCDTSKPNYFSITSSMVLT